MSIMRGYHEAIIRKAGKMSELKKCPFCGEPFIFREIADPGIEVVHYSDSCILEQLIGWFENEEEAIEKLNHRPLEAEIIQDAQTSAGQARYVEAVNDCIKIAEESSAKYLVPKLEELKVKFLEEII